VKKIFPLFLISSLLCLVAEARHIAGGEMSYVYLGLGSDGNLKYRITLKLYRDCLSGGAPLDSRAAITIYPAGISTPIMNLSVASARTEVLQLTNPGPCIDNPPVVCYEIGYYTEDVELPVSNLGFNISYQRCCRIEGISNVNNSGNTGATYAANIPGTSLGATAPRNSSATFGTSDTVVICENTGFAYDFRAYDADGDLLTYQFEQAYDGASTGTPQPTTSLPPPFSSLPYAFPFSALRPMGDRVIINPNTGLVSGTAPKAGIYVLTVVAIEQRGNVVINRHRKDLQIKVAACSIAAADLQPEYITCNGFNLTFQNRSPSSLIKSYYWDFGLPGNADTSNLDRPSFTFPDTGQYRVMLITNRNRDCSDTAYTIAKVYPGFFPKFSVLDGCKNVPIQFLDETTTRYGVVDFWNWTFGHPTVNPAKSDLQNPTYTYPTTGTYQAQLIVGSSFGCRDTLDNPVNVLEKPTIRLTNDTLICNIDTLRLSALGNGTFTWTPNYMISSTTGASPLVSPDRPTKYYATLTSAPGCVNIDSVFVDVKNFVTVNAGNDTTICLTDSIRFNAMGDGLTFSWSPAAGLENPNSRNAIAKPVANSTTYIVTTNIGKCQSSDNIIVSTVPYPVAVASNDTSICFGDNARLFASGGITYRWSPSEGLSNNSIANPTASPTRSIRYLVSVFDNKGCPKPGIDSVRVRVVPQVPAFAGNDTSIVLNQPLQLNATGGTAYAWTPTTGLNNPNISSPVANPTGNISYIVRVSTPEGCFAKDTINVKVFNSKPDIFVPTAFTPNNDSKNDQLIPIPVGITKLEYFKVYNRYGELVFNTTQIGRGWDGRIKGKEQNTSTYVWYVQGVDYTGKTIFKKGTSTLIR
jgi:gliding motility-associated-like protein